MCKCKKILQDLATYSEGHTGNPQTDQTWNVVNFLMTRNFVNNSGARVVAFGTGILEEDPTKKFLWSPPGTAGRPDASPGSMYFSDRTILVNGSPSVKTTPSPPNSCNIQLAGINPGPGPFFGVPPVYTGPFCANALDHFRLQIDIETGRLTYIDLTWNFTSTLDMRCANGVMYGFSNETTQVPWACVISLTKGTVTKPGPIILR
jgi:hypothetical protein